MNIKTNTFSPSSPSSHAHSEPSTLSSVVARAVGGVASPLRLILVAGVFAFGGCGKPAAPEAGETGGEHDDAHGDVLTRLVYGTPQQAQNVRIASFVAEVSVPPDATWQFGPGTESRIVQWHVRIGDHIEAGEPLADIANYGQNDLSGSLAEATTLVAQRENALKRRREALQAGVATQTDVQDAEEALAQAQAQLQTVRRQIATRQQRVGRGGEGIWRSSVGGVVADIQCAPGAVVSQDTACVRVLDTSRSVLVTRIPEGTVAILPKDVHAQWTPWGTSASPQQLHVARRAPSIDGLSRTQAFEFAPADETALDAVPGQSGRLDLFAPSAPNWFIVPASALTRFEGEDVVFLRADDAHDAPTPIPVSIITRNTGNVVVESEILSADSSIVTQGVFLLRSILNAASDQGHAH